MPQKKNKHNSHLLTGILKVHPRGFGFLEHESRHLWPEAIFIPPQFIEGAVDGDTVQVLVNPIIPEKGPEGKVVKILQRGRAHVAGTLVSVYPDNSAYATVPLLGEEQTLKVLPYTERALQVGDRCIFHVEKWGSRQQQTIGTISGYLGHISDPSQDTKAAIEEYNLEDDFSQEALAEAENFGSTVPPSALRGREDLRSLETFTIDPDTARDFDDALSLTCDAQGIFHLIVHIADVSHYVKPHSALDKAASARCNSVYFPGYVSPMLPHALSSNLCSLKPNVNRLTLSVFMTFDPTGSLQTYRIARSVIRSQKRFTYKEAHAVIEGTRPSKHSATLHTMRTLCHLLKKKRTERGSIEFALPETVVKVDAQGTPTGIEIVEYDITHQMVEEFMLKANEVVAHHLTAQNKPLAYRIHDEPNPDSLKEFALLVRSFGFSLSTTPEPMDLQAVFDEIRQSPFGRFLTTAFIRSMKLASYSTQNIGHYGLCLEEYTHFTSPIRRYVDLLVHRLLFEPIDTKFDYEGQARFCSEKERLAARAESSVVFLKKLRLLQYLHAKNPQAEHPATITSIRPFGLGFELTYLLFEGFVLMNLRHGYGGRPRFQLGDAITVTLTEVDLIHRKSTWRLVHTTPKTSNPKTKPHTHAKQRKKRRK